MRLPPICSSSKLVRWWIDGGRPVRLLWPGANISTGAKEATIILQIGRCIPHKVGDKDTLEERETMLTQGEHAQVRELKQLYRKYLNLVLREEQIDESPVSGL